MAMPYIGCGAPGVHTSQVAPMHGASGAAPGGGPHPYFSQHQQTMPQHPIQHHAMAAAAPPQEIGPKVHQHAGHHDLNCHPQSAAPHVPHSAGHNEMMHGGRPVPSAMAHHGHGAQYHDDSVATAQHAHMAEGARHTAPPPQQTVTPHDVATAFAFQYYKMLAARPQDAHRFYTEVSQMTRGSTKSQTSHCQRMKGSADIDMCLKTTTPGMKQAMLHAIEGQSSANGGIIVLILGVLIFGSDVRRPFSHTVYLAPQRPSGGQPCYYVLNDLFMFNEGSPEDVLDRDQPAAQDVNAAPVPPTQSYDRPPPAHERELPRQDQLYQHPTAKPAVAEPQPRPTACEPAAPAARSRPEEQPMTTNMSAVVQGETTSSNEASHVADVAKAHQEPLSETTRREPERVHEVPPTGDAPKAASRDDPLIAVESEKLEAVRRPPLQSQEDEVEDQDQSTNAVASIKGSDASDRCEEKPEEAAATVREPGARGGLASGPREQFFWDAPISSGKEPAVVNESPSLAESARAAVKERSRRSPAEPKATDKGAPPARQRTAEKRPDASLYAQGSYAATLLTNSAPLPHQGGYVHANKNEKFGDNAPRNGAGADGHDSERYAPKTVFLSHIPPGIGDDQIKRAVASTLKGEASEGRVVQLERGPVGANLTLDTELCVRTLVMKGLHLQGIRVNIERVKTPRHGDHSAGNEGSRGDRRGPGRGQRFESRRDSSEAAGGQYGETNRGSGRRPRDAAPKTWTGRGGRPTSGRGGRKDNTLMRDAEAAPADNGIGGGDGGGWIDASRRRVGRQQGRRGQSGRLVTAAGEA